MKAFTAILALASAANAHMIMRTPTPAGSPDSSPLSGDGSNFPCKTGPGQLDTSHPNVMSIGSSNTLSFTGSATHGGGSCQVSLAKGTTLSKDTKWMVIHSIEGGCPAPNNGNQNLGSDPQGTGASQFQFTIPDHPDLGAGDYTLAWSWNNRIGNREFYMNCAYVQLQGAAKKRYAPSKPAISKRQQAPLPDMFVANLGNGCTVTEGTDVEYPDPGSSVEIGPGANLVAPVGSCGAVAAGGSSGGASSAVAGSPSATAASPVATATGGFGGGNPGGNPGGNNGQYTQPTAFATVSGGNTGATGSPGNGEITQSAPNVFVTVTTSGVVSASSAAAVHPSSPVVTPTTPEPSSPPAAPIGTSSPSVPSTPGSSTAGTACSDEGDWACASDGKSFQRCASGVWSVSMSMPAGLQCTPGTSANFAMSGSGGGAVKRDIKSHIARARHNIHAPVFS